MADGMFFLAVFSSFSLLAWASAAAIPIILHFLSKRYRREVHWAAMQFIAAAHKKASRRFRLWQWLLLALRIAILVLFAMLLADPNFNNSGHQQIEAPRLEIILLDASLSMQADDKTGTAWERAVDQATARCEQARTGDSFLLLTLADELRAINNEPTFDNISVVTALRALQPTDARLNMADQIDNIIEFCNTARQEHGKDQEVRVTLLTDLQATSWDHLPESQAATQQAIHIIDVGTPDLDNHFVSDFSATTDLLVKGQSIQLQSVQRTTSAQNRQSTPVSLSIDGNSIASQRVDFGAAQTKTSNWETTGRDGYQNFTVTIDRHDALEIDNRRHLTLQGRPALRITCLGPTTDATQFIAQALRSGTENVILVSEVLSAAVTASHTAACDILVLCDLPNLSTRDLANIEQQLGRGDHVLAFLPRDLDIASYNSLLTIRAAAPSDRYRVDPLNYQHPITETFKAFPNSGLLSLPIFRYWPCESPADTKTQNILQLQTGDPLLLTKNSPGEGILAVFTSPLTPTSGTESDPWNAIAIWPSFIPLVQETIKHLASQSTQQASFIAGESIILPAAGNNQHDLQFQSSHTRAFTARPSSAGKSFISKSIFAGVFEAVDKDNKAHRIAINTPPEESELTKLAPALIPQPFQVVAPSLAETNTNPNEDKSPSRHPWFPPNAKAFIALAVLVVLLLLAEAALSSFMRTRFA